MIIKTSRLCLHSLLWVFTGFLAILLSVQSYIAWQLWNHDRVPLPAPLVEWLLERNTSGNFDFELEQVSISADGTGIITGLEIYYPGDAMPSVRAEEIAGDLDLSALFLLRARPDWAHIHGLEIAIPALLSPTGVRETLLSRASLRLMREDVGFSIDYGLFFSEQLKGVVSGEIEPRWFPAWLSELSSSKDTGEPTAQAGGWISQWLALRSYIRHATDPILNVQASLDGTRQQISANTTVSAIEHIEQQIESGRAELTIQASWDREQFFPPELKLNIENLRTASGYAIQRLRTRGVWRVPIHKDNLADAWQPAQLDLSIQSIESPHTHAPIDAVYGTAALDRKPGGSTRFPIEMHMDFLDSQLGTSGWIDLHNKTAALSLTLNDLSRACIEAIDIPLPDGLLAAVDFSSVHGRAQVELSKGWKSGPLTFRISTGPAGYKGVEIYDGQIDGILSEDQIRLESFEIDGPEIQAEGSLAFDIATQKLDLLVEATALPTVINPWLQGWWSRIWDDFTFEPNQPPTADLYLSTQLGKRFQTHFLVGVDFDSATYKGISANRGSARVWGKAKYTEVYDIAFEGSDSSGDARLAWIYFPDRRGLYAFEYDFAGRVMPEAAAPVLPKSLQPIPRAFSFEAPPEIQARGFVYGTKAKASERVIPEEHQISVMADTPGSAYGVHLSSGNIDVVAHPQSAEVQLSDLSMGGGIGQGTITLDYGTADETMGFDITLTDLQKDRLLDVFPMLGSSVESTVTDAEDPRANIDLSLQSQGPLGDLFGQVGQGTFEIYDTRFANTRLFGGVSRILEKTAFPIGSLSIHRMRGEFELLGPSIEFQTITGEGPGARLNGRGKYQMDSDALELQVELIPGNFSETPVYSLFAALLRPVTAALPIRIRGKLSEPTWSFNRSAETAPTEAVSEDNSEN